MASHIYTSFVSQTKYGSPVEGWLGWWQLQTQLLTPPELQMARVLVPNKVRPPHWSIVPSPALWLVKCVLRSRSPGDVCGIKIDESLEVGEIVFEYLDPRSSLWSLDTVSLHTHSCVRQRRPDIRHPPLLLSLHPIDPCLDLDQSEASIQVTWSLSTNHLPLSSLQAASLALASQDLARGGTEGRKVRTEIIAECHYINP